MNIPKSAKIGGFAWDIVEDNHALKDSSHYGETRHTKQEIALDTGGRSSQRVRSSLMHELIHACADTYLTNDDTLDERQVRALGQALFDTFIVNPHVVDFIMGRNEDAG